ncbi:Tctex-1 [Pyronema domesticum]|nr:Tctex-1 [Pyronema domesticum]
MADSKSPVLHTPANSPVALNRLKQITNDACTFTLEKVEAYDHSRCEAWNSQIINHILRALISESTPSTPSEPTSSTQPTWKFAVTSTIIQHLAPRRAGGSEGGAVLVDGKTEARSNVGRRGMHCASGAYWNNERDGQWSHKYQAKGMDVVINVIWIGI